MSGVLAWVFWIIVIGGAIVWWMSLSPEERKLRSEKNTIERQMKKASKGPYDHSRSGGHGRMKPRPWQVAEYQRLAARLDHVNADLARAQGQGSTAQSRAPGQLTVELMLLTNPAPTGRKMSRRTSGGYPINSSELSRRLLGRELVPGQDHAFVQGQVRALLKQFGCPKASDAPRSAYLVDDEMAHRVASALRLPLH